MENSKTNKYYFQGMRFVPGYNDFDWDDCVIEATNEKDAWDKLFQLTKRFTWKTVGLTHINNVKLEKSSTPA